MNRRSGKDLLLLAGGTAVLLAVAWSVIGLALYGSSAMMPNLLAGLAGASVEVAVASLVVDRLMTRHQRRAWDFAYRALAKLGSETFVDVMRLMFVSFSVAALEANIARYHYFVQLAKRHLDDLRSHIESSAAALDPSTHDQYRRVERRLSWCLEHLREAPTHAGDNKDLLVLLSETAPLLFELLTNDGDGHRPELAVAESSVAQTRPANQGGVSQMDWLESRLPAQSLLLEQLQGNARQIFSISEDVDGDFSIPYFMIDYLLQCHLACAD
jgi:hypothetical protein